jgi:Uncharacterized conserved protein
MTGMQTETRSVVVEREFPHPPERVWRALTEPHLIGEWLMEAEFRPEVGHDFSMRAEWGSVECRVVEVEAHRRLAYTWGDTRLKSTVTWTLTPTAAGTRLRMEQTGFRDDQPRYYQGAAAGWPNFLARLESLLDRME